MFDLCQTLQKYLRTFLNKNAFLKIGLTDQSGNSIFLLYGQSFHPYSIYKEHGTICYILNFPKQYTFIYVFILGIYRFVLIPNYKSTYNQSDQIEK